MHVADRAPTTKSSGRLHDSGGCRHMQNKPERCPLSSGICHVAMYDILNLVHLGGPGRLIYPWPFALGQSHVVCSSRHELVCCLLLWFGVCQSVHARLSVYMANPFFVRRLCLWLHVLGCGVKSMWMRLAVQRCHCLVQSVYPALRARIRHLFAHGLLQPGNGRSHQCQRIFVPGVCLVMDDAIAL